MRRAVFAVLILSGCQQAASSSKPAPAVASQPVAAKPAKPPPPPVQPSPPPPMHPGGIPGAMHAGDLFALAGEQERNPFAPGQAWVGVLVGKFERLEFFNGIAYITVSDLRPAKATGTIVSMEWPVRTPNNTDQLDRVRDVLGSFKGGDPIAVSCKLDGLHPTMLSFALASTTLDSAGIKHLP